MEQQEVQLTGRQQLVFEACQKIDQGKRLIEQGQLELSNLVPEGTKKGSRLGVPRRSHKAREAVRAPRSAFKRETRTDEQLGDSILKLIDEEKGMAFPSLINRRLHISERRLERVLDALKDRDSIIEKTEGQRRFLMRKKRTYKKRAKTKKESHRHGPTPTDPAKLAPKVLAFLNENDWNNVGKISEGTGISRIPLNRTLDYLQKEKQIKKVMKKNNPAHKTKHRLWTRDLPYWEVV